MPDGLIPERVDDQARLIRAFHHDLRADNKRPIADGGVCVIFQALVDPGNIRSRDVCRRLGMSHLGQTVHDGTAMELFQLTCSQVRPG